MVNAWLKHVKAYQQEHPNKSYKQCMSDAKHSYKKGSGFMGNLLSSGTKMLKNELLNKAPLPSFIKDPVSGALDKGIDYGVSKTGLGMRRRRKGGALIAP
jgi:hypothetical protein